MQHSPRYFFLSSECVGWFRLGVRMNTQASNRAAAVVNQEVIAAAVVNHMLYRVIRQKPRCVLTQSKF